MKVLHLSDIHYRSYYNGGNPYEDMLASMDSSFQRLETVITHVMTVSDIDLIVITGDLCDEGCIDDYAYLKNYFDRFRIPTIVCLGNHDIRSSFYEGWMHERKDIPFLESYDIDEIHWISFDNSLHGHPNGYIDHERLNWLDNELSTNKNCIVLMHHQFENLPGIPGMEHSEELISVLQNHPPLAILNGHTHWIKDSFSGDIPVFTAPSISFRAVNLKDGSVVFSQSEGYRLYEVNENGIITLDDMQQQGKELAVWKK